MAINLQDKKKIYKFVNAKENQNLGSLNCDIGEAGPCAGFVKKLIEEATGRPIQFPHNVFRKWLQGTETNLVAIKSYGDLATKCSNGDILVVVADFSQQQGYCVHYMLFCNVLTIDGTKNCLGVNGNPTSSTVPFKGIHASEITANDFQNGLFQYDGTIPYKLYKVDYDLIQNIGFQVEWGSGTAPPFIFIIIFGVLI